MSEETQNLPSPIRDDMVQTAMKFLQNPNVINTPLAQKQKFLQRKGLTDQEIQKACEKSGAYNHYEMQTQIQPPVPTNILMSHHNQPLQVSIFDRIREIVHNIALFSIVAYVVHKFYQTYIAPFLFGKKKKSVGDAVEELNTNVEKIHSEMENIKMEVYKYHNDVESNSRLVEEVKADISSVKGLLLNRKQFPSVSNTPVIPSSIPAWQLSSVHPEADPEALKEDLLEELGSGSGSSEPEHGMKTSESSLEIIYSSRDYDTESCHSKKSSKDDND